MVKYSGPELDATFAALSDATRRGILARLAQGEASVSDLAAPYEISLPGVSKHLRVLERAKLMARRKDGRVNRCRLVAEPMKDAAEWIEHYRQFWEQQFDALARFLAQPQRKGKETCQRHNRAPKRGFKSGGYSRRRVRQSSKPGPSANI
ncbi:MAG: metalloregulator ArsR/SmtB family transcription factor [Terriglobia bacterium]|jgi:DNA-binding transcriptional ArsR family regulator